MALIKTLRDFFTKNTIYPQTKTNAVYDDIVGRLDTFLSHTIGAEEVDDVESEEVEIRDADTLGGKYTAEDLDAMPHSITVEDDPVIEPPINDAVLLWKDTSLYEMGQTTITLSDKFTNYRYLRIEYSPKDASFKALEVTTKRIMSNTKYIELFDHSIGAKRTITLNSSKPLELSVGNCAVTDGGMMTIYDNMLIPVYIYGIK